MKIDQTPNQFGKEQKRLDTKSTIIFASNLNSLPSYHRHKSINISKCKFSIYFTQKKLLFLFYTSNFTKHSYKSIYSTHLFNKIFIILIFFIIFFTVSLSLRPNHHHHHYLDQRTNHHHYPDRRTDPTIIQDQKTFPTIIQYQKTNPRSKTHSRSENQPIQAVGEPTETHSRLENQTIQAKTTH